MSDDAFVTAILLTPMRLTALCKKCNGKMVASGHVLLSQPPKYPHSCDSCYAEEVYDKKYPYVEFLEGTPP